MALRDLTQLSFKVHYLFGHLERVVRLTERRAPDGFELALNSFDVPSLRLSLQALSLDYLAHLFEELLSLYLQLIEP